MSDGFKLTFQIDPDAYAKAAQSQRDWARAIADQLDRGEPLEPDSFQDVAAVLRSWADGLKDTPKRNRGRPASIDPTNVALDFEGRVRKGLADNKAYEQLAEKYGVSIEAIKSALDKPQHREVIAFLEYTDYPHKRGPKKIRE